MLLRYTAWANTLFYDALQKVPEPTLTQVRPGRIPGLARMDSVMGHIYVVGLIWKGHLTGQAHGLRTRMLQEIPPLAELRERHEALDRWYIEYGESLTPQQLEEAVNFQFVDAGGGAMRRDAILLHAVNHATYHRGFVADMLGEAGVRPPTNDLTVYPPARAGQATT
jgi:uncharacterized damage-inducible protein DinB